MKDQTMRSSLQLLEPHDQVKMVFDSVYGTTKTLSPHLQTKIKKQILTIVNEVKTEVETEYSTCSSYLDSVMRFSPSHHPHMFSLC